ncbi:MAG: DUF835 domain-containing protein [Thermoplasmata archaeon]|nr:MAG: DUF835 domain-containing protein [Thermoplasmata archaeon]
MSLINTNFLKNALCTLPHLLFQVPVVTSKHSKDEIAEVEGETKADKKGKARDSKKASYIVSEKEADVSFEIFYEMLQKGYRGLCITKTPPGEIKSKYGIDESAIIWLTSEDVKGVPTISPMNLQHLHTTIKEFIERGKNNVVLLDSLEFLIAQNAQNSSQRTAALKSIQVLIKTMGIIDSPLIIPVTPSTIEGIDTKNIIKSDRFVQFNVLDVLFTLQKNVLNAFIFEIVCNDIIHILPKPLSDDVILRKIKDLESLDPFFSTLSYQDGELAVDPKAKLSRLELIKNIKVFASSFKDIKEDIDTNPPFINILNKFGLGESEYFLSQGWTYIVEESKPDYSFDLFQNLIHHGLPGLCISRIHPNMLREKYRLNDAKVFWLSKFSGEHTLNPADVGVIVHTIKKFLDENEEGAVLLHGIGNIITNTSFTVMVKVLDDLCETVMLKNARLILPVNPEAYDRKEFALLSRDKEVLRKKDGNYKA